MGFISGFYNLFLKLIHPENIFVPIKKYAHFFTFKLDLLIKETDVRRISCHKLASFYEISIIQSYLYNIHHIKCGYFLQYIYRCSYTDIS